LARDDRIRVLIADDHPVVLEGLCTLINRSKDMTVVAQATNGRQAVAEFLTQLPDVGLVDLRMPEVDGVEAIAEIRERVPTARLVVLTTYDDEEDIYRGLRAGAKGYLLKDAPREELLGCIRAVHEGRTLIPQNVAAKLADRMMATGLTARETDVLRLVADGKANKQIAAQLEISEGTVKTHINTILGKLGASDRTQAVTIGLRRGILRLD